MKVNITLRTDNCKEGYGIVYLYYSLAGYPTPFKKSLKTKILKEYWNGAAPSFIHVKGKKAHPNGRLLNRKFNEIYNKGESIIIQAEQEETILNFKQFCKKLFRENWRDFYEVYPDFVEYKKLVDGVVQATVNRYNSNLSNLKKFAPKLTVGEINVLWIAKYEQYMREEKGNSTNTIYKNLDFVKMVLDQAVRDKLIRDNPFKDYKIKTIVNQKDFLIASEVQRMYLLYQSNALKGRLHKCLKFFLFQTQTGIDYGDIKALTYEDNITQIKGHWAISKNREKKGLRAQLGNWYFVPLSQMALSLIDVTKTEGKVFEVITNQQYNKALKEISVLMGITKNITTHIARHTFASLLAAKGVREEVISKYLGQKTKKVTAHYTKYTEEHLIKEFNL